MVVYEVSLEVDPSVWDDFQPWLLQHLDEMVALSGFVSARAWRNDEDAAEDGWIRLVCTYVLQDDAALGSYLREDAPRMREDGLKRYPNRFRASRRTGRLLSPR